MGFGSYAGWPHPQNVHAGRGGGGKDFRVWINRKGQYKFHLDIKNGISKNILNRF